MSIRRLPSEVINRIAAGEVVERPASALKELIENALDADARNIAIRISAGGLELVEVADDGHGMSPSDMSLAVERHATSKLPDDAIEAVTSFGFRGEALPSIASVSRLTLESRPRGQDGWRIEIDHGAKAGEGPAASHSRPARDFPRVSVSPGRPSSATGLSRQGCTACTGTAPSGPVVEISSGRLWLDTTRPWVSLTTSL